MKTLMAVLLVVLVGCTSQEAARALVVAQDALTVAEASGADPAMVERLRASVASLEAEVAQGGTFDLMRLLELGGTALVAGFGTNKLRDARRRTRGEPVA
jgi:hypothetical protein